jgi:hypothetical protein
MKLLIVSLVLFLNGCSTVVPVAAKFPDAPGQQALVACPNLQKLKDEVTLSDIGRTVTINYSAYYECAVKTDAWIEWYQVQQKIYESVK